MLELVKIVSRSALFKRVAIVVGSMVGMLFIGNAFAAGAPTGISLTALGKNVDTSVYQMARILTDVSLIAGIGFIMASFFKFHQHKLNPTQVPLSQGVTLMLIGAGLALFPTILPTATKAVFGSAQINKVGGGQIGSLIGTGS